MNNKGKISPNLTCLRWCQCATISSDTTVHLCCTPSPDLHSRIKHYCYHKMTHNFQSNLGSINKDYIINFYPLVCLFVVSVRYN